MLLLEEKIQKMEQKNLGEMVFAAEVGLTLDGDVGDGDGDGDGDSDGDDEKTFISSASTATPIAAIACFGQLIWSKIIVNLSILGVCAIILMINLSTDEVAARSGWVTMSTRLCDSCKVN